MNTTFFRSLQHPLNAVQTNRSTFRRVMTLLVAILTSASAWAFNQPKSCLDYCHGAVNNIIVVGWAFDPDASSVSTDVHVYVYQDENYTKEVVVPANLPRPDVNATFTIAGNHGFRAAIPINNGGTYYVKVVAIDATGDDNLLMNSPYTEVYVTENNGEGTVDSPFWIASDDDWNMFSNLINNEFTGFFYSTCSYELDENVGSEHAPLTTMFGTADHPFCGTFDGRDLCLYVNIVSNEGCAAPFHFVSGATIKNLHVDGLVAVNTDENNNHAGGLVGYCKGGTTVIDGCTVHARVEAHKYAGGIVGHGGETGLVIKNSVFDGELRGFTKYAGGLVGWCDGLSMTLSNCLVVATIRPGNGGFYHPIALTNNPNKAKAEADAVYYWYEDTPTATTNLVPGADGIPVSEKYVPGEWTIPVHAANGHDWYAAGAKNDVTFADGTIDAEHWSIAPENPVYEGNTITLTYSGSKVVKSVTATIQWDGDLTTLKHDATVTNGMTLRGKLGTYAKLSIADGAIVKLQDVTIDGDDLVDDPWPGIYCEGDATLILSGTNYVKGFSMNDYPAIFVPEGKTLTIRGDGSLEAYSFRSSAAIGGGYTINGGNIVIEGGTIYAHANTWASGIGGGYYSSCGDITITDGVTRVTASKGYAAPYSIGPGYKNPNCGTITIGGEVIDPISESPYTYTGKGTSTSEMPAGTPTDAFAYVSFEVSPGENDGTWTFTMPACNVMVSVEYEPVGFVTFAEGTEDVENWSVTPENPVSYDDNVTLSYSGTRTVENVTAGIPWDGNLADVPGDVTATDGMTLTGKLGAYVKVSIADGATVVLQDVTIEGVNWAICPWAGITCEGDATLILKGTNYVKGFHRYYSGIYVPEGRTLTIRGNGSLVAYSGNSVGGIGAGIGGGYYIHCGNIVIEGGTIVAYGGSWAAGIGGGQNGNCGNITITDGVTSVTAVKIEEASYCIGSGMGGYSGTITIGGEETGPISSEETSYTYTGTGSSTGETPEEPAGGATGYIPLKVTYHEDDGFWSFTMPTYNVVVFVEYEPIPTSIEAISSTPSHEQESWYTIDGRKLNGEPSARGVYIKDGRTVLVK